MTSGRISSRDQVQAVRRFNRLVTLRAGALEERFLGRDRPLGESRVLYEIGRAGASLRDLRTRLALDSGYLSRLVQRLEAAGLVELRAEEDDERVRQVELTAAGRAELAEIDRRSDEAASSILEPLDASQRARLAAAMDEVHRLLGYSVLHIEITDPDDPAARWCLSRYYEELAQLFEEGFEPEKSSAADTAGFAPPRGAFLVARIADRPVACGAVTLTSDAVGYIKRMWVDASVRGLGLGRRMLEALEATAADLGCDTVQLETNRALTTAIRLYRSAGYEEVDAFNDEHYAHHWFEKGLS